ncbi:MAG: TetR/AcrR family transcriptional regulator [Candidatus Eremiobacteraeota bacterium]|nr:TetR/AcrR family transcriptional regulator [Candidatus Eremiobacteraeota bacterium]
MASTKPAGGRLYGGLSAPERRAERRARFMRVGLELFGTVGFQKTTIPHLCSAAGVTARHFYDEFDSREALLRALYDEIADEMQQRVIHVLREPFPDVRERIRASNAAYFTYLTDDPRLARIYALEAIGVSAELELHRRAKRESLVKTLTRATQRLEAGGVPPVVDPRLFSAALAGGAHDLLLEWVLAARPPSVEKMADTITTIWINTLKLDDAGRLALI